MSATSVRSWVESAQDEALGFSLDNLPFGVFSSGVAGERRIGIAIGGEILDVRGCLDAGLMDGLGDDVARACGGETLNELMALGRAAAREARAAARRLLEAGAERKVQERVRGLLFKADEATLHLPARIGDYTDFYASIDHATNVGAMFRPDNPLLPNYKYVPIGYHGRASSIVPSGTPVRRPLGQTKPAERPDPRFGPSRALDYEVEVGFYVAGGNELGDTIPIEQAADHIFGFCLVNDWSARDIQSWEYQPLGPFLAKNFATSVSPWVVLTDALDPFRVHAAARAEGDPQPMAYLSAQNDRERGAIALTLEAWLTSERMRAEGIPPVRLSEGDFARMYWTPAQMLAHHASNGCNLQPGDLLASGTVSGPRKEERGCMLELTSRGADPFELPTGEKRSFLEDGDEVVLRGWCRRDGLPALSFGECRGTVIEPLRVPAVS